MGLFGNLFRDKSRDDEFCRLCENGSADDVKTALESWGFINARSKDGKTPLICAVKGNNVEAVKILTEKMKPADINESDSDGKTALYYATVEKFNPEILDILLKAGAEIDKKNNKGRTLLMEAAGMNQLNTELIYALVSAGADIIALLQNMKKIF